MRSTWVRYLLAKRGGVWQGGARGVGSGTTTQPPFAIQLWASSSGSQQPAAAAAAADLRRGPPPPALAAHLPSHLLWSQTAANSAGSAKSGASEPVTATSLSSSSTARYCVRPSARTLSQLAAYLRVGVVCVGGEGVDVERGWGGEGGGIQGGSPAARRLHREVQSRAHQHTIQSTALHSADPAPPRPPRPHLGL